MAAQRDGRTRVLFLCTGNSCRSQMAEGFARALRGDLVEAYSAGVVASGLDPRAVRAMAEAGVDISGQRSKSTGAVAGVSFDYVVTLCDSARESCPLFPGEAKTLHVGFDDPPALVHERRPQKPPLDRPVARIGLPEGAGPFEDGCLTEEEAMAHYRRVRDEIRAFVEELPGRLGRGS